MSFPGRFVQRTWHLVDATSQTVGRLATTIAPILKGKHKPTYRPDGDCGDHVVVINADKVRFTGKKWDDKIYRWHTGYPGGLKERPAKMMHERKPTFVLKKAILGMLHRNNLRRTHLEPRLRIYAGPDHPHTAQLPQGVATLPPHPRRRRGTFHFGLGETYSATPYVAGGAGGDEPGDADRERGWRRTRRHRSWSGERGADGGKGKLSAQE